MIHMFYIENFTSLYLLVINLKSVRFFTLYVFYPIYPCYCFVVFFVINLAVFRCRINIISWKMFDGQVLYLTMWTKLFQISGLIRYVSHYEIFNKHIWFCRSKTKSESCKLRTIIKIIWLISKWSYFTSLWHWS